MSDVRSRRSQRPYAKLNVNGASEDQKRLILEYAEAARQFEIERFWQRSTFFWALIGAAFVAYGVLYEKKGEPLILISGFGVVASLSWTLQNRGSKYWQEAWEQKIESVELSVLGAHLFSNREHVFRNGLWGASEYSVSKLAIAISDFAVSIWISLLIIAVIASSSSSYLIFGGVVSLVIVIFAAALLIYSHPAGGRQLMPRRRS